MFILVNPVTTFFIFFFNLFKSFHRRNNITSQTMLLQPSIPGFYKSLSWTSIRHLLNLLQVSSFYSVALTLSSFSLLIILCLSHCSYYHFIKLITGIKSGGVSIKIRPQREEVKGPLSYFLFNLYKKINKIRCMQYLLNNVFYQYFLIILYRYIYNLLTNNSYIF